MEGNITKEDMDFCYNLEADMSNKTVEVGSKFCKVGPSYRSQLLDNRHETDKHWSL